MSRQHANGARLGSIQRLRGLAALLVVFVHAIDLADRAPDANALAPIWLINDLGASGVDLFFVLSGFVMTFGLDRFAEPGGARRFLTARAIRILPLFWLLNLLLILLLGMLPEWRSAATAMFVFPVADGRGFSFPPLWVGWTLAFEFAFYLMVAVAVRSARPALALLSLIVTAGGVGALLQPTWPVAQVLLNPILLEFGFGVVICLAWQRGLPRGFMAPAIVLGSALLLLPRALMPGLIFSPEAGLVIDGSLSLERTLFWGLPWALILLGVVAGDIRATAKDALHRVGDASYSLYLSHAILVAMLERSALLDGLGAFATIATAASASVAVGLATHHWVERPIGRLLGQGRPSGTLATLIVSMSGSKRAGSA